MRLLEPLTLGPRTAPNRVVFGPHETNLAWGRAFSERHVAYYRRRAAGGAGVIVTETASVHPSDWPYERAPLAADAAGGWAAIAAACHEHGSVVIASLGHTGGQGSSAYSQSPLWAPSRVPEVNTREVPKWMEVDDIEAVVDGFAAAARVAASAGLDGVEIDAGPYGLVRQFLSGLTNQRDDEWGTDRLRFAREVIAAVRGAVGPDVVVGLRLSCDELAPWAGIVPEAAAAIAVELAGDPTAPTIEYLTVTRGAIYSAQGARPDGHTEPGHNLGLAGDVRAALRGVFGDRVAVIAQGSIVDVGQAEWAVGEGGRAEGVEMTRALLADAALVSKAAAGRNAEIRPCILCNQTCAVRDARNPVVTCVVDPRTGHELDDVDVDVDVADAAGRGQVIVVGGGVAGMEAARVAAGRGRRVRLVERGASLGGMVPVAAAGSGRHRLALFTDWLASECERLGVEIALSTELTAGEAWDGEVWDGEVIVAVGSARRVAEYRTTPAAVVLDAAEVLATVRAGGELPDGSVLVWDPIGGPVGVSVAELLAAGGRDTAIATPDQIVGNELSRSGDLAAANARLQQAGVTLHRRSVLRVVRKGQAELEDRFTGSVRKVQADVVIDAGHRVPAPGWEAWAARGATTLRAGDLVAPRTIAEAVLEARRAALALDGIGVVSDGVALGELGGH